MTVLHARVNMKKESDFSYTYTVPEGRASVIIFKSPAEVLIDDYYVPVRETTAVMYHSGSTMTYRAAEGRKFAHDFGHFQYRYHSFSCGYDEEAYLNDIPDSKPISLVNPNELSHILKMIVDEAAWQQPYVNENIGHLIFLFFNLLKREYSIQTNIINQGIHYYSLYELRSEIYAVPEKNWTVEQMCQSVHLSIPYFQHLYKQYFDVSPVNDLIKARIEQAKKKLIYSREKISFIAEECGYQSLEHFNRQFKDITGFTPSKYRSLKG